MSGNRTYQAPPIPYKESTPTQQSTARHSPNPPPISSSSRRTPPPRGGRGPEDTIGIMGHLVMWGQWGHRDPPIITLILDTIMIYCPLKHSSII